MVKRVISVVSGKGGVGKSTIATNIATLLSMRGTQTLLIDCDFYNPSVLFHFGVSPSVSGLQELLDDKAKIEDALIIHPPTGLRCISASMQFYKKVKTQNLAKVIKELNYEYIILDCAPGFPDIVSDSVAVSTDVVVVMTPTVPSVMAGAKLASIVSIDHLNKKIYYVLNRVAEESYELHFREVENLCKNRISGVIHEDPDVPRSLSVKTPLVLFAPQSKASKNIGRLNEAIFPTLRQFQLDGSGGPDHLNNLDFISLVKLFLRSLLR